MGNIAHRGRPAADNGDMGTSLTDLATELHASRVAYADWANLPPALRADGLGSRLWCRHERARLAFLDAVEAAGVPVEPHSLTR